MSGFEDRHIGGVWTPKDHQTFPGDFSLDEAEFASELHDLFGPEREDLPPLYTQTLLENAHISAAGPGFEQKTAYRVFRRLRLTRSPLISHRPSMPSWRAVRSTPRSVALSFSLLLVFMVFTMVLASPAFGAGVRILLGQTGVEQVQGYPAHVRAPSTNKDAGGTSQAPLSTTMPISWLGPTAGGYSYVGMQLFPSAEWSNGPIADLQYTLGQSSAGIGVLDIREFQVSSQYVVLQVVKDGSATTVQAGDISAIYVNGSWMPFADHYPAMAMSADGTTPPPAYLWVSGERSELIFEQNGIVFWVSADQRDGTGESQLVGLVQHLVPLKIPVDRFNLRFVDDSLVGLFRSPVGTEVYQLVPRGGDSSASGTGVFVAAQAYGR